VEARIDRGSTRPSVHKYCLSKRKYVSIKAKRGVDNGLVFALLLYGAEHCCLRLCEDGADASSIPPSRCMRTICRLNLHRTLLDRLGIQTIETYLARRQLRWLGHVRWMLTRHACRRGDLQSGSHRRPMGHRAHLWAATGTNDTCS
jgi:hypothetical protein